MAAKPRRRKKRKRKTGNRSVYWQECGKKNRYHSEELAEYAAEKARKRGESCHVYKCDYGKHWHIAHDW